MNNRIKELRKKLKLTQEDFANKLGLARNSIASYESGRRSPNDAVIKLICREYHVDYYWLTEGKGEMFIETTNSIVDEIVLEYGLNENSKAIILAYLEMDDQGRKAIEDYFLKIAEKLKG